MGKSETRVKKASKYCIAVGCFNNDKNSDCTFFAVPTGQSEEEVERCKKWLTLLGREDLLEKDNLKKSSYCVCCAHFDDSQIKMLKTLRRGAIPTLLLPNDIQEGSTASTDVNAGSSSTRAICSEVKDAEMISVKTECAELNIELIKTEPREVLSAEEEEGLNAESSVPNVIVVKCEFESPEEAMEKSTQTPKGLKKRKRTDDPKKKCKSRKGDNKK
ncbi:uncharacterized protein LOC134673566 [Cydia fagiglandana]|uniref:uncharacterized protein LOC134673566 n=1 Tax=Cydia fagiglandana TaxID=1458189 RepID=UPI002FEDF410